MTLKNDLYKISRWFGKASSTLNDIETLATGDPKKIAKRIARKELYKTSNKVTRKISKKI